MVSFLPLQLPQKSRTCIGQIEKSIEQLLKSEYERKDLAGVSDNEGKLGNTTGTASASSVRQRPVANNSEANVDIDHQEHFRAIKEALQRVKLPSDLKVDDSRQGMKRSEMNKNFIITKCASYCENMWGPHTMDRFASLSTAQLQTYNSRYLDPWTSGVDALAQTDWSKHNKL